MICLDLQAAQESCERIVEPCKQESGDNADNGTNEWVNNNPCDKEWSREIKMRCGPEPNRAFGPHVDPREDGHQRHEGVDGAKNEVRRADHGGQ